MSSAESSSPLAPPSPWRWPRRLDTLRVKLFVAIAGANAVLALVTFLVFSWSFDQGFVEYLNRGDEARLSPLIVRLAEGHRTHGNWRWVVEDRRKWFDLQREVMGVGRMRRSDDPAAQVVRGGSRPSAAESGGRSGMAQTPPVPPVGPPMDPLLTIDPRLLLFGAQRQLLIGREDMAAEAVLRPIQDGAHVVGFLGYVPRLKTVESLEKVFAAQQNAKFAAIGVGMLVAGLLIGALIAWWLSRRIRRLAQGAGALIQGQYAVRIDAQGHDELAQLAQDFNHLAQTLEAAREARQQWIADIAHELRTPLAVLRAEIEAMQDGVRRLDDDSLSSLAQEVGQLSRLVEDLRMLSLSDMGALTYQKEPLGLGELVADCVAAQAHALESKGIEVSLALPASLRVMGDGTRLAQVFGNLLQNTLRYTDSPGRLDVQLKRAEDRLVVVWQDSSPGVPDSDLARLTDRLFRVDASRSRAGGGSGLGLAITQAIIEAHGGELVAGPSPLGGLRWTVTFPVHETHPHRHD